MKDTPAEFFKRVFFPDLLSSAMLYHLNIFWLRFFSNLLSSTCAMIKLSILKHFQILFCFLIFFHTYALIFIIILLYKILIRGDSVNRLMTRSTFASLFSVLISLTGDTHNNTIVLHSLVVNH